MRLLLFILFANLHAASWEPVEVVATAYCPCRICCGVRAVGLTADGTDVREWPYGIAVDPCQIDYGTPIIVPRGEGYLDRRSDRIFYADDTGGIIRRKTRSTGTIHIDLRFKTHWSAERYGKKTITIFIYR